VCAPLDWHRGVLSRIALQDRRDAALARLAATKNTLTELQAELEAYGACDPVKVEQKRRAVVLAREAALRHTGNLMINACSPTFFFPTRHFRTVELMKDGRQLLDFDVPFYAAA
jgi:hypothetical protein